MEFDDYITNEKIKKNFDSQFDLVNHLIAEARSMISTGREGRVDTDSDNIAVNVVAEVAMDQNKPKSDNIIEKELVVEIDNHVVSSENEVELASQ